MFRAITLIVLAFAVPLTACAPLVTEAPTFTPQPSPTNTLPPSDTPTATASATSTATLTPTETPTPLPTETPSPTVTASRTRVPPTPIPPTNTPAPRLEPALFPKTPIQPFEKAALIDAMQRVYASTNDFYLYFKDTVVGSGQTGDCSRYWSTFSGWENAPAFSDVPDTWYDIYYQYRITLLNYHAAVKPIEVVCQQRQGTVPPEEDQIIVQKLASEQQRMLSLIAQAQALP